MSNRTARGVSRRTFLHWSALTAAGSAAVAREPLAAIAGSSPSARLDNRCAGGAPIYPGSHVPRGDARYPTLVRGFNQRWTGQPHYVALCGATGQVVQAVQRAVDDGRRITVRSGGHCYEDFVCDNKDGVLLDLSSMNATTRTTIRACKRSRGTGIRSISFATVSRSTPPARRHSIDRTTVAVLP